MNKIANVGTYAPKVARFFGLTVYISCLSYCVCEYIGNFVICDGPSMEPTINSGDIIIAVSSHLKKIEKGDIIVTKSPSKPTSYVCKRVIALPGDKIPSRFPPDYVQKGHVWLEGDNKYNSVDSRIYGAVPQGLIKGTAVCRIWPLSKMKTFTRRV